MKKILLTTVCALLTTVLVGCSGDTPEANPRYVPKPGEKMCCHQKKQMVTETILFANDSAVVSPMGEQKIKAFLKKAKDGGNHDDCMYYVSGYTNSVGNPNYNERLSKKRAEAVRKVMMQNGIAKWRIKDKAFGEMYPAAPTTAKDWKSINRRVVIGFEPAHK